MTIEETHKDGVDSTVLTLSTGSHEQDVKAMLELYDDLIERDEPQNDQETTRNDKIALLTRESIILHILLKKNVYLCKVML